MSKMFSAALLLIAFCFAAPTSVAGVCYAEPFPDDIHVSGQAGVDTGIATNGLYVCVLNTAVGVDVDYATGGAYIGADVEVLTCTGTTCTSPVEDTGVWLIPGSLVCVGGSCYTVKICVDNPICP